MPVIWILTIVLAIGAAGFIFGRRRAVASAGNDIRNLHSLPHYYGLNVAMTAVAPALGILGLWLIVQPILIEQRVTSMLPDEAIPEASSRSLVMSDVRRLAEGLSALAVSGEITPEEMQSLSAGEDDIRERLGAIGVALGSDVRPGVLEAAESYRGWISVGHTAMTVVVLGASVLGFAIAFGRTRHDFRARNTVERGVLLLLIAAASVAILTTVGIVLSLLFESINFFRQYPFTDFLFGTNWAPNFRGNSDLGILPLLWGTL